jgi:hypothetical protein
VLVLYALVTQRTGLFKDDTRHYALMAQDPTYLPRLPYAFRVLTPLLVQLMPLETVSAFTVVTLAGLWLCALFLYAFLRALGLGPWATGAGVVLFLGSGATTRALTTPLYVDTLTYLTELAAFYFLLVRREAFFGATLVLGTLNRETTLFLAPVYLLQLRDAGRLRRSDLPRVALVLGAPVVALLAVAATKLVANGALVDGAGALAPRARTFEQNVPSLADLADIYSVFGAAWLLAAANLRQAPRIIRHGLAFGLLVVLQLAVSRGDESRNLSHLLPLVIPLAALEFQRLPKAPAAGLLLACLASVVNARWVILPNAALRYGLVAAGSLAALALMLRARLSCSRHRGPEVRRR